MSTFDDMIYALGGVPVIGGMGEVALAGGKWYFCDPTLGSDSNDGKSPDHAKATLLAAYNLTRDGYNDGVIFIAGATAWNPAAAFDWAHSYTHLIGTNALPGVGNRCRIVGLAATALTVPVTISGSGCLIKNIQFNNEYATGAVGCALVTGSRNIFENCFFMTPSGASAASYALKLTGSSENLFHRCSIGQITNPRSAASYSLWITGSCLRNKFIKCEFSCWSTVSTHVLVKIATDVTSEGFVTQFEDCLFDNLNGGSDLAHAIVDGATETHHQIIMRGVNTVVGCSGFADVVTYVFSNQPAIGNTWWTPTNPSN